MTTEPSALAPPPAPAVPPPFRSRERDEDRTTRKPLGWWDRGKLLALFLGAWLVMLWTALAQFDPQISATDALNQTLRSYWWLLALALLETIRQLHYLMSEHSARYHRFWTHRVFARFEARTRRMNDWTRFRVARVLKLLFVLVILDLVLAKIYHLPPATALIQIPVVFVKALPVAFQLAFGFFFIAFQFIGLFWFLSRGGVDVYMPDDIKTRFTDVWGQDSVLTKVKENMVFLEDPESIEAKGGYVPGGILLWGPPGTGKTLMAEAVAGETGKPFVFVDPGAFINMFFGVGILKVKSLFRKLRKLAVRYGGVIVFFDEADSLGNRGSAVQGGFGAGEMPAGAWATASTCNGLRYVPSDTVGMLMRASLSTAVEDTTERSLRRFIAGAGMGGGGTGTLQALLTELSGLKKPRGFVNRIVRRILGMRPKPPPKYRILVMMATNMPQALDEALLRPGRIDRIYKVGYPSKDGRRRTYEGYLAKVPHQLTDDQIERLATITPYATGASIKDMVNEGLINAIRGGRVSITWQDIIRAKHLKEMGPAEGVEYIERERHAIAVHEACHAVIGYLKERWYIIDLATIEKGGDYLGMVKPIPPEDQHTKWRTHYEAEIMTFLASLAGERLFFDGDSSSGVLGDLESATEIAIAMEGYWGMGSTVASHRVTQRIGAGPVGPNTDDEKNLLKGGLGKRIEDKLEGLLNDTAAVLEENRHHVLAVAHALETHKTISGDDVSAIIEGTVGPLVDGRIYHLTDFAGLAEAYHHEAVAAHKAHAKVGVQLPALVNAPVMPARPDGTSSSPGGNGQVLHEGPESNGERSLAGEEPDEPRELQPD